MKRIQPVIMILAIAVVACNNHHKLQSIKALSSSLERVNALIRENIALSCSTLEEREKDPQTKIKADIWTPRGFAIKHKSDTFNRYVDAIKAQAKTMPNDDVRGASRLLDKEGNKLFDQLMVWESSVIQILAEQPNTDNPAYQATLNKDTELFKKKIRTRFKTTKDSASDSPVDASLWIKKNFRDVTPVLALAMLTKIQNDVLVTTNDLLEYCKDNTTPFGESYDTFKPIVTLDRSYVKSGQSIEVCAGIGCFSTSIRPVITMDGKRIKAEDNGVATCIFYAKKKVGTYTIPVTIEYPRPDGSKQTISKNIKYTVGE
jgi:hypothetical protein